MTAEKDLSILLAKMNPVLHPDTFVFATLTAQTRKSLTIQPIMEFHEAEGVTVVVKQDEVDKTGFASHILLPDDHTQCSFKS